MRRISGFFFCAVLLQMYSSPVGNPMAPELIQDGFLIPSDAWVDLRIGYEGDFVGNGKLEQTSAGSGPVDEFRQYTNSGLVTLNILDRLDLYGVLGSSRICSEWRVHGSNSISLIEVETRYGFLWGGGVRATLIDWGHLSIGAGGRYSVCHYEPCWLTVNAAPSGTKGSKFHWRQWQVDAGLAYQIDLLTPYVSVAYSDVMAGLGLFSVPISNAGAGFNHFRNRGSVGVAVGCSISNGKYFMLNVEGRFIDESAGTISGDIRF